MKLLFIYGSPAVGKLTVANKIAEKTDFKVFHNHLSIDCITPVFEFGSASFHKLIDLIRTETIAEAARSGQNLIYTFCYAKELDDPHVEKITRAVEENGGEVHFVLLTADKAEIEKRVLGDSRQSFGKVKTVEMVRNFFDAYDLFSPVSERESLIIDNTNVLPETVARQITEYFNL